MTHSDFAASANLHIADHSSFSYLPSTNPEPPFLHTAAVQHSQGTPAPTCWSSAPTPPAPTAGPIAESQGEGMEGEGETVVEWVAGISSVMEMMD